MISEAESTHSGLDTQPTMPLIRIKVRKLIKRYIPVTKNLLNVNNNVTQLYFADFEYFFVC